MRFRFWGTRGSIAKPGPATLRYGGNTSCVEVRSNSGTLIVLDCGTGAHALGHALVADGTARRGHILITHTHWDHIQGFPFFAPLRAPGNEWDVYGPRGSGSSLRDTMSGQMQYEYFPVTLEDLDATVRYHDLVEGTLDIGDVRVTAHYLHHPALTLGYRLEVDDVTLVYASDHEPHSRHLALGKPGPAGGQDCRHLEFLAGADILIHDAQYTAEEYPSKAGWGHSTIEYVVDSAVRSGVRQAYLYHHDPMRDDDAVDDLLKQGRKRLAATGSEMTLLAAREGDEVEVATARERDAPPERAGMRARALPARGMSNSVVLASLLNDHDAATIGAALERDGPRLVRADSLDETLEQIRQHHPSLLLLDEKLGDGISEVCRAVRAQSDQYARAAPIIVVAERDDPSEQQRRLDAGVTDWLFKPFSGGYAQTRVRAWLLRTICRWRNAPQPPDESTRSGALRRLALLDTSAEERFDRYTRIASALFDVPIALITLVAEERQWFKSRRGLEETETHRDVAFCSHAILSDDILQVEDTLQDDRFADNPVVTGELRVRFYAGVPLRLKDGHRVGTLCLVDHRPRLLDEHELSELKDLGALVERELQLSSDS